MSVLTCGVCMIAAAVGGADGERETEEGGEVQQDEGGGGGSGGGSDVPARAPGRGHGDAGGDRGRAAPILRGAGVGGAARGDRGERGAGAVGQGGHHGGVGHHRGAERADPGRLVRSERAAAERVPGSGARSGVRGGRAGREGGGEVHVSVGGRRRDAGRHPGGRVRGVPGAPRRPQRVQGERDPAGGGVHGEGGHVRERGGAGAADSGGGADGGGRAGRLEDHPGAVGGGREDAAIRQRQRIEGAHAGSGSEPVAGGRGGGGDGVVAGPEHEAGGGVGMVGAAQGHRQLLHDGRHLAGVADDGTMHVDAGQAAGRIRTQVDRSVRVGFLTTRGDVVAGFNIDTGMWDMELLMVYFLLFASYGRVCWFEVRMFGEDQCCMERVICLLHILCVPIFFNSPFAIIICIGVVLDYIS